VADALTPQILGPAVDLTVAERQRDPALGLHTKHEEAVARGLRAPAQEEHHAAMLQATARVKTPAYMLMTRSASARRPDPAVDGGASMDGLAREQELAAVAATLVTNANGNEREALMGSVRRERQLRRELAALQKQLETQALLSAQSAHTHRVEAEALTRRLDRKGARLDATAVRAKVSRDLFYRAEDAFSGVQRAINELGSALAATEVEAQIGPVPKGTMSVTQLQAGLQRASDRYASLPRLVDAARRVDACLQELGGAVADNARVALGALASGAPSGAASVAGGESVGSGYLAYSSLAASALPPPQSHAAASSPQSLANATARVTQPFASASDSASTASPGSPAESSAAAAASGRSLSRNNSSVSAIQTAAPSAGSKEAGTAAQVAAFALKARRVSDALQKEAAQQQQAEEAARKGYDVEAVVAQSESAVAAARALAGLSPGTSPRGRSQASRARSPSPPANLSAAINAARGRSGSVISRSTNNDGRSTVTSPSIVKPRPAAATAPAAARRPVESFQETASAAGSDGASATPSQQQQVQETTVADTLVQLFRYFSLHGDRESDSAGLTSKQFFRLVREAGMLDNRVTHADADLAFTRAAAQSRGPGQRIGAGFRMGFEAFIAALNDLAVRRYRGPEAANAALSKAAGAPQSADPDSFRQLLQDCLLPVYARLKNDALFVSDVAEEGAAAAAAAFADEFLRPEVLAFFNDNKTALQSIFGQYALMERSGEAQSGQFNLSRAALLRFAADYKIVPDMLSRPELLKVLRDASRAIGCTDAGDDLSYPEWVEVLGMLAFILGDHAASGGSRPGYSALGLDPEGANSMRTKLELLFFNMRENGARFAGEAGRMMHAIAKAIEAAQERILAQNKARTAGDAGKRGGVRDLMGESLSSL
jgi:hypothetical protein